MNHGTVNIVLDVWRADVKGSFGCDFSSVTVNGEPPLRVMAYLKPKDEVRKNNPDDTYTKVNAQVGTVSGLVYG